MHGACAEAQSLEEAAQHLKTSAGVPDSEESITGGLKKLLQVKILNDMQLTLTQTFMVKHSAHITLSCDVQ
jgi:hypothetical protein